MLSGGQFAGQPLAMPELAEVDPADTGRFGGKAAGLARLIRAGAAVPPGFAVEVTARPPASWSFPERAAFLARAGALLAHGPIAVRSSAAVEDGVIASYAGLFESVLGVETPEAALAAAARCIASGGGERVLAYARCGALPVGVVCQSMVPARAAGVCFTVDPTGRDGGVVIEAVAGRGESLVSGHANPDRWRVYHNGFGAWEAHAAQDALRAPFTRDEAIALARSARDLAARFGCPLDLEWAHDAAGRRFWVQARPVTVAAPPPTLCADVALPGADDGPVRVWANFNVRETMPEPLPPFSWSIWRDIVPRMIARMNFGPEATDELVDEVRLFDRVNGRVYWNLNALIAFPGVGARLADAMNLVDPRAGRVTRQLLDAGVLAPRRFRVSTPRRLLRLMARQLPYLPALLDAVRPRAYLLKLQAYGERERARRAVPLEPLDDAALLGEIDRLAGPDIMALRCFTLPFAVGLACWGLARRLFAKFPEALKAMGSGISLTPTAAMSLELDELVQQARPRAERFMVPDAGAVLAGLAADEHGRAWLAAYRGFLHRNAQRCPREFDFAVPRWDEAPEMLIGLVRASLKNPPDQPLAVRMRKLRDERQARIDEAIAGSLAPLRPLMGRVAAAVDAYLPLREAPKHYMLIALQRVRHAALEAGRRLVQRGLLDARDDVFFLEYQEVKAALAGADLSLPPRELVARRLRQHRAWAAVAPPDFVRSDGVPVEDTPPQVPGALASGVPASIGIATGPVRVLHHPDAETFQDGDVLVVELADPGWTPLFPRACAIVMEVGGLMCHAAVVARELGIPAVVGVRDARARLKNGQRVTVDGERGVILQALDP